MTNKQLQDNIKRFVAGRSLTVLYKDSVKCLVRYSNTFDGNNLYGRLVDACDCVANNSSVTSVDVAWFFNKHKSNIQRILIEHNQNPVNALYNKDDFLCLYLPNQTIIVDMYFKIFCSRFAEEVLRV